MRVEVALALLERDGLWLLQLRDDIEGIVAPGCWGLFGGHLEPGESPEEGLRRELQEEISYPAASLHPWWRLENDGRIRHFFSRPLDLPPWGSAPARRPGHGLGGPAGTAHGPGLERQAPRAPPPGPIAAAGGGSAGRTARTQSRDLGFEIEVKMNY